MESQPQNPEFRNNPENFHQWYQIFKKKKKMRFRINERHRCFGFSFKLILYCYASVNSYGHIGIVISPNHTFFLGKLD